MAIGNSGKTPVSIKHGMHLGKTTVFFIVRDYFVNLAQDCKFTIIGKLYRGKPTMDDIRREFVSQFQLRRTVKIAHFDHQHVYLDFDNEVDFNRVGTQSFVNIGIAPMKIMKWTPDFRLEVETSIVPVWILILQLPWHLFRWDVVSKMGSAIGTAVAPDMATYSKSRGNVAKIKVEIDLLKPKLDELWLGFNTLDGKEGGVWLNIEYWG